MDVSNGFQQNHTQELHSCFQNLKATFVIKPANENNGQNFCSEGVLDFLLQEKILFDKSQGIYKVQAWKNFSTNKKLFQS